MLDTDIILLFDKGHDAAKINIHTLCAASTSFFNILDFTFLVSFSSSLTASKPPNQNQN